MQLVWTVALIMALTSAAKAQDAFTWPEGKRVAVSLTFDDARTSQVDVGLPLFERYDARATFYVVPGAVEQLLAFASDSKNGIWIAPVAEVSRYVEARRAEK